MTRFLGKGEGWSSSSIARGRFEEGVERNGTTPVDAADGHTLQMLQDTGARYWQMLVDVVVH